MTANAEANVALMREAFAALNRKDIEACVAMLTPDFIINIAGVPYQKRGVSAWRKNAGIMLGAFPDTQVEIEDMFAGDDKVAVRLRITGTHQGEFLGQQPTGAKVSYESNELYRVESGKIAEEWICSDSLTLLTQIGAISKGRLVSMWLAGKRVWFALAVGIVVGAGLALLL